MAIRIGTTIGTEITAKIGISNKMKIGVATIKEGKSNLTMIRDHKEVEALTIWAHITIK